jgi:hypothetical protein
LSELPEPIRVQVITELYGQADELDWDLLTSREKAKQYEVWIDDPKVGGVLTRFLEPGRARVWIKDVPMKEYARAREGIGSFAQFTESRFLGPDDLISRALGKNWHVIEGSVREKPMQCRATDGHAERYVFWGKPQTFRDLVWAGVNQAVATEETPLLIVTLQDGHQLQVSERNRQEAIARHCGLDIRHVRRSLQRGTA